MCLGLRRRSRSLGAVSSDLARATVVTGGQRIRGIDAGMGMESLQRRVEGVGGRHSGIAVAGSKTRCRKLLYRVQLSVLFEWASVSDEFTCRCCNSQVV